MRWFSVLVRVLCGMLLLVMLPFCSSSSTSTNDHPALSEDRPVLPTTACAVGGICTSVLHQQSRVKRGILGNFKRRLVLKNKGRPDEVHIEDGYSFTFGHGEEGQGGQVPNARALRRRIPATSSDYADYSSSSPSSNGESTGSSPGPSRKRTVGVTGVGTSKFRPRDGGTSASAAGFEQNPDAGRYDPCDTSGREANTGCLTRKRSVNGQATAEVQSRQLSQRSNPNRQRTSRSQRRGSSQRQKQSLRPERIEADPTNGGRDAVSHEKPHEPSASRRPTFAKSNQQMPETTSAIGSRPDFHESSSKAFSAEKRKPGKLVEDPNTAIYQQQETVQEKEPVQQTSNNEGNQPSSQPPRDVEQIEITQQSQEKKNTSSGQRRSRSKSRRRNKDRTPELESAMTQKPTPSGTSPEPGINSMVLDKVKKDLERNLKPALEASGLMRAPEADLSSTAIIANTGEKQKELKLAGDVIRGIEKSNSKLPGEQPQETANSSRTETPVVN